MLFVCLYRKAVLGRERATVAIMLGGWLSQCSPQRAQIETWSQPARPKRTPEPGCKWPRMRAINRSSLAIKCLGGFLCSLQSAASLGSELIPWPLAFGSISATDQITDLCTASSKMAGFHLVRI